MSDPQGTPPPLKDPPVGPSAKEKRYDRQLRLWAASGQAALEKANVLLLNSGPGVVGVETLKNLILPGVGNFAIFDDATVEEKDLGVNFFLDEESLGRSRAVESMKMLKELNPDVLCLSMKDSVSTFVELHKFETYSHVLLIGPSPHLQTISSTCWEHSIPLFYIHSLGFFSHFSIQLPPQFPIVDTHPDPASTQDLRLLKPWPELQKYAYEKTKGLDTLSDHDHGHIPWLLLLLYYIDRWKETHEGLPPKDYDQKKEFKKLVESGIRRNTAEGSEENFEEGAAAVLKSLNPPTLPSGLRSIFTSNNCTSPDRTASSFWLIASAIRTFHSKHDVLPLPGAVPDMKAQSADYIALQTIYRSKARADVAEVTASVRELEKKLEREKPVPDNEIEAFCKGAAFVKLIEGRPIFSAPLSATSKPKSLKELNWSGVASNFAMEFWQQEESSLPVLLAFLAYDEHVLQHSDKELLSSASAAVDEVIDIIVAAAGVGETDVTVLKQRTKDVLAEFDRADGGELHNISSLAGGIVAQEIIKVITKQYVPVDNACVFDGIVSKSAVFKT